MSVPFAARFCLLVAALAFAGCSGGDKQVRFRVSGNVKFAGQNVPYGEVLFTPDGALGNSGAQGIATIKDGKYDTAGSRAPGTGGGPMVVRVTALSDPSGKLICEHEFKTELPKSDTTQDIDIPAAAGKKKTGPEI
jgi:hypothetical protein